jgi:glycosyltransferase involved in cell wall biosynthesis
VSAPRFSIVIPTRNRAGLLRSALAACAVHDADDLEILVSDNCSRDDTREVAATTGDSRVRYVRADTPLSQPDSWEFAVTHARGDWITILGDDDGFVPSFCARLGDAIGDESVIGATAPVVWREAWYFDAAFPPAWLAPGDENAMTVDPFSGRADQVDSRHAIHQVFRMHPQHPPGFFNAAVHRSTVGRVRAAFGRVFRGPDPYITSGISVLTVESHYRFLDVPLTVRGFAAPTLSMNYAHNTRDAHEVVREYDHADLLTMAPLRERTLATLVADSLLCMKRDFPGEFGGYELDLVRYFTTCRRELAHPNRKGDGGAALAEWRSVLRALPAPIRAGVRRQVRRERVTAGAQTLARRMPGLGELRGAFRGETPAGTRWLHVKGAEVGFVDLPGAARYLEDHVLPTRAAVAA